MDIIFNDFLFKNKKHMKLNKINTTNQLVFTYISHVEFSIIQDSQYCNAKTPKIKNKEKLKNMRNANKPSKNQKRLGKTKKQNPN